MTLDLRILGPVEIRLDGAPAAIGGNRQRVLLAVLASRLNRVASVSAIAAAIWGDTPPVNVDNSVQVAVSALRRVLSASGDASVQTVGGGYRLSADEQVCDLGRFTLNCAAARDAAGAGRTADAATRYRSALAEWIGPAVQDLRGNRFADELGAALDEQRLTALEARLDLELALGGHRELVPELSDTVAEHPLREAFWAQLMLALYRCGRQSDALAAYRTVRTQLADELGVEPGRRLRDLERAVLQQSPELDFAVVAPAVADTLQDGPSAPAAHLQMRDRVVTLGASPLRIGRLRDNGVVLDDPRVSRHHAAISVTSAGYLVTDLHSTNGVLVNGERCAQHLLADGDVIVIGDTSFEFVQD